MRYKIRVQAVLALAAAFTTALPTAWPQDHVWKGESGKVHFISEAPLETITAESQALRGIIDPSTRAFAFTIKINSFKGFNSDIQLTHFLENYMEEKKYPYATFTGRIIEDIPFDVPGAYPVRAKGQLEIHGISKERIIRGTLLISGTESGIRAEFPVPVADHGIRIPKLVKQKIAEQIRVTIDMKLVMALKS